jgi:hypothetical protein
LIDVGVLHTFDCFWIFGKNAPIQLLTGAFSEGIRVGSAGTTADFLVNWLSVLNHRQKMNIKG